MDYKTSSPTGGVPARVTAKFHIICERDVGLFSLIQQVTANIKWALHENRIPIVYFGLRNCYWTPNGYRDRDTVWEYYFEPAISAYSVSSIPCRIREFIASRPPRDSDFGYFIAEDFFVSNNFGHHPKFGNKGLSIPYEFDDPSDALRHEASEIIHKFVRPRAEILEKADRFFAAHLQGRYIIGVHLRGTDALVEEKRRRLGHHLEFSRYFEQINELLGLHPDAAIFVASDADSSVVKMQEVFGSRVVATAALRHQSGALAGRGPTGEVMPAHLTMSNELAARGGEDAVVDYLLLSRCHHLIHNGSSLARTVMLNVPRLPASNTLPKPSYLDRKTYYWSRRFKAARGALKRMVSEGNFTGSRVTRWQ